ncbi:hypothetical protein Tco_0927049 [Tanacetum coccineum]|uniref:Uncharacterized protein n=1 Tax=Tanacetum coccineum TaxID=301880 RepID=A0ABQ5DBL0_9ASTR
MASSCCSLNVTPTPVLDEIIALSGETEIPKVMKIFFEQQIAKEEAFIKYIRDKIDNVKASLIRVRTTIHEMESKSDKDAWKDAIDYFKETKDRLELKLSRLTQLADENFDGVKEQKVHSAVKDCVNKISGWVLGFLCHIYVFFVMHQLELVTRLLLSIKDYDTSRWLISGGRLLLFYTYQSIPYISSVVISSTALTFPLAVVTLY